MGSERDHTVSRVHRNDPPASSPPVKTLLLAESPLLARLDSFRDLAAGWDSYGAQPIDPRAIAKAQELLHSLTVVPTARGGVQIEMSDGSAVVELDISPSGMVWRIG